MLSINAKSATILHQPIRAYIVNQIFITGRFCSGTTFLWNFFNWTSQYCAYYEPLHPGLLASIQHISPKQKHKGVDNYWQEYLRLNELPQHYSPTFGFERLTLQENEQHQALENYLHYLIQHNDNKSVAIKFNRVDFRLGWLKQRFPTAKIIHIERNIRDSWKSSRAHLPADVEKDMYQFNAYELIQWVIALDEQFPFIIDNSASSYHLHYFIAKLSEKFSRHYAHVTINFERDIIKNFDHFIEKISTTTGLNKNEITAYIQKREIPLLKEYTVDEIVWLENVEKECDKILNDLGVIEMTPETLLKTKFPTLYPDKRKQLMQHLLAHHYLLEDTQIVLQGELNLERATTISDRIKVKIKHRLGIKT